MDENIYDKNDRNAFRHQGIAGKKFSQVRFVPEVFQNLLLVIALKIEINF